MEAALVLLGTLFGFAASYILEARKRNWTLDEQWRERERADLENVADRYRRLIVLVRDIMDRGSSTDADREEGSNFATESYTNPSLSNDDKLWKMAREITEESTRVIRLVDDKESSQEERNDQYMRVLNLSEELQRHINALIKQTYK